MRLSWRYGLAAATGAACFALAALAAAVETHADDTVHLTGAFDQLLFAAGDEVTLSVTATDDVAAAGGDVSARGATFDDLFMAGGELSFIESTARDLFAAGGEIDVLTGQVTDDLVAAGGRITIGPAARVDGDVVISGGRLSIEAPIGGGLRAAGGVIRLDGPVTGDVYLDGGTIVIGPDARIGGTLTHRGRSVRIAPEAQVAGEVTALRPRPEPDLRPLAMFGIWMAAAMLFGLFLMAVVIAAAFPRLMNDTAEALRTRPLTMLGLGVLLAIVTPVLILFLIVTLLGLPLAFVIGAAFALLWPLAIVGAVYTGAMLARTRMRSDAPAPSAGARAVWAGVAMIVFILIGLIPVIGFLVWLIAYLFGLGAVTAQALRALSKQPQAA
jgi:cytoskeletal protein CcmA (bactofilin family)